MSFVLDQFFIIFYVCTFLKNYVKIENHVTFRLISLLVRLILVWNDLLFAGLFGSSSNILANFPSV